MSVFRSGLEWLVHHKNLFCVSDKGAYSLRQVATDSVPLLLSWG
jgi:hypothetical protein